MQGFGFVYRIRNIIPFTMGMGPIPWKRFPGLNAIGAALWITVTGTGVYLFGRVMESFLGSVQRYEGEPLAGLKAAGALFWLFNSVRTCRKDRSIRQS